jgi:hypothetical protein
MFDFLRKKTPNPDLLESARVSKVITEEEFWELKIKRAERKLKELREPKKK